MGGVEPEMEERDLSNDSRESPVSSSEFVDGYPAKYECDASSARSPIFPLRRPDPPVIITSVSFEYELLVDRIEFSNITDFRDNGLPGTEWGLLWNMALKSGIISHAGPDCMLTALQPSFSYNLRRRRLEQDAYEAYESDRTYVVGLNSLPRDDIEEEGSCRVLKSTSDFKCLPVLGTMQVQYTGDDKDAVETYIFNLVQSELDNQRSLVKPVQRTVFIPDNLSRQSLSANNDDAAIIVGSSVACAAGIVLIIGLIVFSRRKRRPERGAGDIADLSTVAVSNRKTRPPPTTSSSRNQRFLETTVATVKIDDDISSDGSPKAMSNDPSNVTSLMMPPTSSSQDPEVSSNSAVATAAGSSLVSKPTSQLGHETMPMTPPRTRSSGLPVVETVTSGNSDDDSSSNDRDDPVIIVNPFASPADMPEDNSIVSPESSVASNPFSPDDRSVTSPSVSSDAAVRVEGSGDHMIDSLTDNLDAMEGGDKSSSGADTPVHAVGEAGNVVEFLPPLPPGHSKAPSPTRPQSQPLKKKRKKKKVKKQKNALTRINSRENITEMESIPEEDNSYQDDVGSEYSWETDDEDSGRAARELSPARSLGSHEY